MKGGRGIESFIQAPEKYYTQFKIGDYLNKDELKPLFKDELKPLFKDSYKIGDTQLMLFEGPIEDKFYSLLFSHDILTLDKFNDETEMSEIVWKIQTNNDRIQTIQVSFKADPDTYYTQFKIGDTLTKDDLKQLFKTSYKIGDGDTQLMLFNGIIKNYLYTLLFQDNILTLSKKNNDDVTDMLKIVWQIITEDDVVTLLSIENKLTM